MAMEFGIQFFPCVGPAEKSAADYWGEALHLVGLADELGFTSVRTVEHYFHPYGGYSPNPVVFLAAAAMRTRRARLVTGAVLPAFNNPLKVAGELAMLDAISGGRLEAGFARAFLPHEFSAFGVPLDESRTRYGEGWSRFAACWKTKWRATGAIFTPLPTSPPCPVRRNARARRSGSRHWRRPPPSSGPAGTGTASWRSRWRAAPWPA